MASDECVGDTDHEYQFTTVEYTHPRIRYRAYEKVTLQLQMDYGEIVAGASIDVSRSVDTDTDQC